MKSAIRPSARWASGAAGSLAMTVGKLEGLALPTLASATGIIYDSSGSLSLTNAPALSKLRDTFPASVTTRTGTPPAATANEAS